MMEDKYGHTDYLQYESGELDPRSVEYCSYILEALETGQPFRFNGNVMNDGYIANLPRETAAWRCRSTQIGWACTRCRWGACRVRWRP